MFGQLRRGGDWGLVRLHLVGDQLRQPLVSVIAEFVPGNRPAGLFHQTLDGTYFPFVRAVSVPLHQDRRTTLRRVIQRVQNQGVDVWTNHDELSPSRENDAPQRPFLHVGKCDKDGPIQNCTGEVLWGQVQAPPRKQGQIELVLLEEAIQDDGLIVGGRHGAKLMGRKLDEAVRCIGISLANFFGADFSVFRAATTMLDLSSASLMHMM